MLQMCYACTLFQPFLVVDVTLLFFPGSQLCTGEDPATKVREGDFSNIWQSSLITGSLL